MQTEQLTEKVLEMMSKLAAHDEDIKTLFKQGDQIKSLAESTNELAQATKEIAVQISGHEARLSEIEDSGRYKMRTVWACIVTGILGAAIAYVMTALLS